MDMLRFNSPVYFDQSYWDVMDYPPSILYQHFGNILTDADFCPPTIFRNPDVCQRTQLALQSSGVSTVKNEKDKFVVTLDVSHFKFDEIDVKVVDKFITIHAKHGGKADDHGFIEREFTRGYVLPAGTEAETVNTTFSSDGILTIVAPKKVIESTTNVVVVPITKSTSDTTKKEA